MNSARLSGRGGAFTLIEVLCVVAIIAILAALLLPALNQGQAKARRIQCVDNLKQVGVGFHAFMHDHHGRFPMQVPMSEGGSLEFAQNGYRVAGEFYFSFRHFAALSNELGTPKILACPSDSRWPARSFGAFDNDSLSYFIGVQADFMTPYSILAGDRNITNDHATSRTIVRSTAAQPFRWTEELHRFKGNLLFADGHVQELNQARLSTVGALAFTADLVLPSAKPALASSSGAPSARPAPVTPAQTAVGKAALTQPAAVEMGPPQGTVIVSAREAEQTPREVTIVIETNLPPATATNVAISNSPPAVAATAPTSGGSSGFAEWMEDLAGRLSLPVWLLYLLLLLLLGGIGTMALALRLRTR